jgi:DtxR family Mn-dependent transcriptional regulator
VDKDTEEILELIWIIKERNEPVDREKVLKESRIDETEKHLSELKKQKLIDITDSLITLTRQGEETGREIVRRQRLAEWLLSNVLELEQEHWEDTACEFEHILSSEVTESICTFLGHPPLCPHGKPIPSGDCCKKFSKEIKPLVLNITELSPGASGRIVFIAPKHHDRLDRLSSFGIVPGAIIKLHQKQPAYVLNIGETSIALDADIAKEIYVKKVFV